MGGGGRMAPMGGLRQVFGLGDVAAWTDGQLLDRFATRGDEAAFEALVGRHGPMVLGVCRAILGDPHEAQDAYQATFLVLVRQARSIRRPDAVAPWLHGVARRVAMHARRSSARRRFVEGRAPSRPEALDPEPGWSDLHEEIDRLPEKYRAPIVLCGLQGRTHDEAAAQLGWPEGTVKVRLMRARARLRDRLVRLGLAPAAFLAALDAGPPASAGMACSATASPGTVPGRAAALADSLRRSLLMAKVRMTALACLAAGGILWAASWGAHPRAAGAPAQGPPKSAAKAAGEPVESPPFEGRYKGAKMAFAGNFRPLLHDDRGWRFQSREAIVHDDGSVRLWDWEKKAAVGRPWRAEGGPIRSVYPLDASRLFVTRTDDGALQYWDGLTGDFRGELKGQLSNQIEFGCAEQAGPFATVAADGRSATVWDPATIKPIATLRVDSPRLTEVVLSRDGKTAATVGDDRSIGLWEVSTARQFATLRPPSPVVARLLKEDGLAIKDRLQYGEPFWEAVRALAP